MPAPIDIEHPSSCIVSPLPRSFRQGYQCVSYLSKLGHLCSVQWFAAQHRVLLVYAEGQRVRRAGVPIGIDHLANMRQCLVRDIIWLTEWEGVEFVGLAAITDQLVDGNLPSKHVLNS